MQMSIENLFKMVEQRFGDKVATTLLILVVLAVAVFALDIIGRKALWPAISWFSNRDFDFSLPPIMSLVANIGALLLAAWVIGYGSAFIWTRMARKSGSQTPAVMPSENSTEGGDSVAAFRSLEDAIERLVIEGNKGRSLSIRRGVAGWPVGYPIKIRNTRSIEVALAGYTVTILFNDIPVQTVTWEYPSEQASNGVVIVNTPFEIPRDDIRVLNIPLSLPQVSSYPDSSPAWGARGELRFRVGSRVLLRKFDFSDDRYRLSETEWSDLRINAAPR